ncbi:flavin-containing monooxygenase [Mesorhizobium shangrilense]|uniref:NAD(P)/FAD-dependent oxidoreductase n=1 Tax=Mesorhizobium shangrilense TaxID=460060 RepID=A0ABV2D6A9_9HYPH
MHGTRTFDGVIVIGAGAAGLAATHALIMAGVSVRLLEKEDRIGEPWRRRHHDLHLNTHRSLSRLPGVDYPAGTPAFPDKSVVIDHLDQFRSHHRLPIEFGVCIDEIAFTGSHWTIATNMGTRTAAHVVIATGRDRTPYIPKWKGMAEFPGRIIHSADFGNAGDYANKKVLVVGAGNSGFDVLNHLGGIETSAIWLSARHGPTLLPKRIFNIPVHLMSPYIARLPVRLADALLRATQRMAFGDLTRFNLPAAYVGGASRLAGDYVAIASDDGAVDAIKAGKIEVVAEVGQFDRDGVILANGQRVRPDIVIAATGYRTGLEQMVGKLGVLDAKGYPLFNGAGNDQRLPGLWFIGMRPSIRGCFANARLQARAIAAAITAG